MTMEPPEPELHGSDPRELEPRDFKHVVVLLKRGDSPLSRDQLENIVHQKVGEHPHVIVHFLYGGRHSEGGMYPSLTQVCSPPDKQEYRSRYWHVEEPAVLLSPDNAQEKSGKRYRIYHGPPKEVWEIVENPDAAMWKIEEKKTLKRMREILTMDGTVIDPWFSGGPQVP